MSKKVSFEVQVLQGGRWELHASYPADQQGQAIQDAKALENISTISSVKVIREEIDPDTGASQENNIFASANLPEDQQPAGKTEAKKAKATGGGGGGGGAKKPPPVKKKTAAKTAPQTTPKKSTGMQAGAAIPTGIENFNPEGVDEKTEATFSIMGLLIKLLMALLFSAIIASLISSLVGVWLRESSFRANTQSNILFGLFIGTFAISLISMGMSLVAKARLKSGARPRPAKAAKPAAAEEIKPAEAKEDHLSADFRNEAEKTAKDSKDDSDPEVEMRKDLEEKKKTDEKTALDSEIGSEIGADIGADIGAGINAPWVKKQQKFVMDYLIEAMELAGVDKDKLDNFNKFGVNLFIAGACETLSQEHNLDGKTMSLVISKPVSYMGFRQRDAEAFADKIPGYLIADSKYMQAYQAGRSAMKGHFDEDPDAAKFLKKALEEWNKPKEKGESGGPVTVLFTDIAGSTNMTQTMGDAVAQQVVRAHNRIVRDALSQFNGTEIKHTGDGIMASFSTTSNGIDAAADMQKGTLKHNANYPDLPLGLKIGINAGEPIAEDNDLFG
ncbi:MAG: adenylate/guanylate cyclase domain-containing protein, partial [Rhodospirillales bacterium]|nr:adenylate/guanylate cyclase domain-containing protein [Rhodospirillales bacterium]